MGESFILREPQILIHDVETLRQLVRRHNPETFSEGEYYAVTCQCPSLGRFKKMSWELNSNENHKVKKNSKFCGVLLFCF